MQLFLGVFLALSASLIAAQDASQLPSCSLPCFAQYVPNTGCQLTDYTCQCLPDNQNKIKNDISQCVLQKCTDQQDQLNTLSVTNAICAKYGPSSSSGGAAPTAGPGSNSTGGGLSGGGSSGGETTASSSSSIKMGPQASYFTAAAQPMATAGSVAGAVVAVAGIALL